MAAGVGLALCMTGVQGLQRLGKHREYLWAKRAWQRVQNALGLEAGPEGRARRPGGGRALNQRMRREKEGAGQPGPGGLLPGRILAFLPSEIGACGPA